MMSPLSLKNSRFLFVQSNPENTVGVLTMAGKGPRVLITPTNDLGKILQALHGMASLDPHYEISLAGISSPDIVVFHFVTRLCGLGGVFK